MSVLWNAKNGSVCLPGAWPYAMRHCATPDARRRLFDEMGRWLGAYMYGQVRDQLL